MFQFSGSPGFPGRSTPPSSASTYDRDDSHLNLLGVLFYVFAGLSALLACCPVIHLVLGLTMLLAPQKFAPPANSPSAPGVAPSSPGSPTSPNWNPSSPRPTRPPSPQPSSNFNFNFNATASGPTAPMSAAGLRLMGMLFTGIAAGIMTAGWAFAALMWYAGRSIRRRAGLLRCQVLSGIACVGFPLGTALGVFALVVLLRPGVAQKFTASRRGAG